VEEIVTAKSGQRTLAKIELLRVTTAGSVDDGKSTLIGRLLYDAKQICEDQLDQVAQASARRNGGGGEMDLALFTDGLRAERDQGITIDVAYRHFATPRRRFIIADTPGHVRYTRNMVTGASTSDLALILLDARKGVLEQSRRHAFIASLLRIPHLVVCVNKMDLVGYSEGVFDRICEEFSAFTARLQIADVTFIPISALAGDNVVDSSPHMRWYGGTPLLYHLEHVHIASDRNLIDVRLPVQWVVRPSAGSDGRARGYTGTMASGVLRPGDEIVVLPSGDTTRVTGIEVFDTPCDTAYPPMSVNVHLADELDVSRGDVICRPRNQPAVARDIDAIVCWMSETPLRERTRYMLKHTTKTVRAIVSELVHRIDVDTLRHDEDATGLELNEIGRLRLRTSMPLVFDPYQRNRTTGAFILIDEVTNDTVGAGMITGSGPSAATVSADGRLRSANVTWEPGRLDRKARWQAIDRVGATVWITGLPAAGKSTLGGALEERLVMQGIPALRLDGDNLRHGLNGDLGFDESARRENVRRTAHVARLLAESGTIALVSLVSPYAADRLAAAELHAADGLEFAEIFVDAPLELCEERDPKGLYARARAGELEGLTGVGAPYERPSEPALVLGSHRETVDAEVERVMELLAGRGLLVLREADEG
jgi:bifunctional enzyme CysN/CysC